MILTTSRIDDLRRTAANRRNIHMKTELGTVAGVAIATISLLAAQVEKKREILPHSVLQTVKQNLTNVPVAGVTGTGDGRINVVITAATTLVSC